MTDYFLAVGSTDDTLRTLEGPTFDVATTRFASGRDVNAVAFSPDGRYLAVGHSGAPYLTILDTSDWSVVTGLPASLGVCYGCSFSPGGDYLAVAHSRTPYLAILDTSDWSEVSGIPALPNTAIGCAWSPDGSCLAATHNSSSRLTIFDVADWSVIADGLGMSSTGYDCAFSPDGAYLAVPCSGVPYLKVFATADWSEVSGIPALRGLGRSCAWSPDGTHLVAGHYNSPHLTILDTVDWSMVAGVQAPSSWAYDCAFSPDGAYLAVAHNGAPYLTLLDTSNWSKLPVVASDGSGRAVAWLPDINRPTRHGILYDHDGNPLSLPVQLLRRPAWVRSQVVNPDPVSGAFTVRGFAPGDYHLLIPDTRPGATDDRLLRITLDETTGALAPLAVHMPYAGALATISGNATKAIDGSGADDVIVRAWGSHGHVIDVVPAPSGDWSAEVPPGTYDITYRSAGCQPVCHGPYTITAPEGEG